MANRKEAPKSEEMMAPMWVTTFTDLISLLVTFFVLLFTFSSLDEDPLRRVQGALGGGRGEMAETHEQNKPDIVSRRFHPGVATDLDGVRDPARRRELEQREDWKRKVQSRVFDVPLDMQAVGDGLRITLEGDRVFAPGTTVLLPRARETILEIARMVRSMSVAVTIETHVDSHFSHFSRFKDARVMTSKMALDVAGILVRETAWPRTRIAIAPYGDSRPRATNDTSRGRERNRRIGLIITPRQEGTKSG